MLFRRTMLQESAAKCTPSGGNNFPYPDLEGDIVEGTSGIQYLLYARIGYWEGRRSTDTFT